MERFRKMRGTVIFIALALAYYAIAWAAEAPFIVRTADTGRALWFIDSNGIENSANGSRTTAEGVNNGFVVGTNATTYAVLFKNASGTAVTLADTNYAVYTTLECSGTASATALAIISKATTGFTIDPFDALTTSHTLRWMIQKF